MDPREQKRLLNNPQEMKRLAQNQEMDAHFQKQAAELHQQSAIQGTPPGKMIGHHWVEPHPLEMAATAMAKMLRQWPGSQEQA